MKNCCYYTLNFKIGPVTKHFIPPFRRKRAILMLVLQDDQQVTLRVQGVDDRGNPVPIDQSMGLSWAAADTNLLSVTPAPDGSSCVLAALGPLGTTQATCTATINGNQVMGTLDIQIVNSNLVTLTITPDAPGPQPAPSS